MQIPYRIIITQDKIKLALYTKEIIVANYKKLEF
jgi:hypothetical protein